MSNDEDFGKAYKNSIKKAREKYGERYLGPLILVTTYGLQKELTSQPDDVYFVLAKDFKKAGETPPSREEFDKEVEKLLKEGKLNKRKRVVEFKL